MSDKWLEQANCQDIPVNLFFITRGESYVPQVRQACAECVVREACLQDALEGPEDYDQGYRGGLTERQRRSLRVSLRRGRPNPYTTRQRQETHRLRQTGVEVEKVMDTLRITRRVLRRYEVTVCGVPDCPCADSIAT